MMPTPAEYIHISITMVHRPPCGGRSVKVRGVRRCGGPDGCGHRLTVNGITPIATRKMPMRTWPRELLDRRVAKRLA